MRGSAQHRPRDERAFEELIGPHLAELHVHCYRMLGSVFDAEDLLQETVVAAWEGLEGFQGRSSVRTWLYRIATNRCLNAIRDGRRRPPMEPVAPFEPPPPSRLDDVTWLTPYPSDWFDARSSVDPAGSYQARESIELTFVAALQRLPPRQTAVLVLCDVLGFDAAEVAGMLDVSPIAVKGLRQRARAGIGRGPNELRAGRPRHPDETERDREVALQFADAYDRDDIDRLLSLLTDQAWLAMPPAPHVYVGRGPIGAFLVASAQSRDGRRFASGPTSANHLPAFVYRLRDVRPGARTDGVMVLTIEDGHVAAVTRFMDARLPALFAPVTGTTGRSVVDSRTTWLSLPASVVRLLDDRPSPTGGER